MYKVFIAFGTRPEAVKMCPLIVELKKEKDINCIVCLTGQHREMLLQIMDVFRIDCQYNLDIMKRSQTLGMINAAILEGMEGILDSERPDIVLVHGDTTSSYAVALSAFYKQIPVGHVEAGLRSGNIYSPFPEEMNRILTDKISSICFAPTVENLNNLKREGIEDDVYVTGNTVIDSFKYTIRDDYVFKDEKIKTVDFSKRIILVTAHRRENIGKRLQNICEAIREIAYKYEDVVFIYPVHLNPAVRNIVFAELSGIKNILLTEPVDVFDMHNLMSKCYMVLTDSGGIQEEAPHLGKPVLVLRTETERPEGVQAGTVKIAGVDKDGIVKETEILLNDSMEYERMAKAVNPYGDGHSSEYIVNILKSYLGDL